MLSNGALPDPLPAALPAALSGPELESRRNRCATVIQAFWRGTSARLLAEELRQQRAEERRLALAARRERAAAEIQACWRGHSARRVFGLAARVLARGLRARAELASRRCVGVEGEGERAHGLEGCGCGMRSSLPRGPGRECLLLGLIALVV